MVNDHEELQNMLKLPKEEEEKFAKFIKSQRSKLITKPIDTASLIAQEHSDKINQLLNAKKISQAIIYLRENSYTYFLEEEMAFNGHILKSISQKFDTPKNIIDNISEKIYSLNINSRAEFQEQIINGFSEYAGKISPYLYQLCLSNTQSRRSRAGKTFEGIIYFLYQYYSYQFDSQSKVGKHTFSNLGLGRIVDSILPSVIAFEERRSKVVISSMKTTLRERWQEVIEEVSRSNIPSIHLLTVDNEISDNKATQMAKHNIILVVLEEVKEQPHLQNKRSIITFENYFLEELPEIFACWDDNKS